MADSLQRQRLILGLCPNCRISNDDQLVVLKEAFCCIGNLYGSLSRSHKRIVKQAGKTVGIDDPLLGQVFLPDDMLALIRR